MILFIVFAVLLCIFIISSITALVLLLICLLNKLKNPSIKKINCRLKRSVIVLAGSAVLITGTAVYSRFSTGTPPILDKQGKEIPDSIAELKKVELNEREEWISIRGKNRNNPVLLFLAGGPGGSQMAAVRYHLPALEDHFVVVNWDQPGSCKSYHAVSTKDITVDTYIQDGYALSQYLCHTFGKEKIYLVGESWGSAFGIFLAKEHPECYYSFIGTGQMVDFVKTEEMDYEKAIEIAQSKNDIEKVEKLKANGKPPYYGKDVTWKSAEYLNYLFSCMSRDPEIVNSQFNTFKYIFSSEYGIMDNVNYIRGIINTFNQVYPQLYQTDLRKEYAKIDIPVYFFIGRRDINAPISLAEDYYNVLNAPSKEIVWFDHSGHSPWINESDKFVQELLRVNQL